MIAPCASQRYLRVDSRIMSIRILVTGGTFDKEYNERTGQLFFKDTHVAEMLRLGRSRVDVTIRTVMMIDSLEMTDADRALIVQNCLQSEEDRIVVTHGTDTMTETAAAVAGAVSGKTVVLTGDDPHASQSMGSHLAARFVVQVLRPGYLAMNGNSFRGIARKKASVASLRRSDFAVIFRASSTIRCAQLATDLLFVISSKIAFVVVIVVFPQMLSRRAPHAQP